MDSNTLWTVIIALLPGILVAAISYGLIDKFLKSENLRREIEVRKINNSEIIPQRLSAYERMALFLERIKPTSLTRRFSPQSTAKNYEGILIQAVQSDWENKLSQHINVNPVNWKLNYSDKKST